MRGRSMIIWVFVVTDRYQTLSLTKDPVYLQRSKSLAWLYDFGSIE